MEKVKLGDICEISAGQGAPQGAENFCACNDGTPFIKAGDLVDLIAGKSELAIQCVSPIIAQKHKLKLYPQGSILFAKSGMSCMKGYIYRTKNPCYVVSHLAIVTPYKIDGDYLKYYFQYNRPNALIKDSAYPSISLQDISNIELDLPSLEEQKAIAGKLDKVSGLIEKRKTQLEKLDLLIKSRFIEMFGDCLTNPKGWTIKNLEDIAEVGSSKRVFVEELKQDGIPFYRGTEVGALAEGKNITPELFITKEHYAELCEATGTPCVGDLLMPSICPDGRIWVVNTDNPFYFKDGRVLWVHKIDASYNPIFLLYTLKDRIMTDYNSIASGTTFAELKIFALKKCRIFDAPIELQNQFATFVEQVDKSKFEIQKSLEKLEILKKSLMQQYFG